MKSFLFSVMFYVVLVGSLLAQDNLYTSDGPAMLPQSYMDTSLASTPSPGVVETVSTTTGFAAAYTTAQCGETLVLTHGVTYQTKWGVVLAAKNCDDQHWITIKTDGVLPPEGTRVTPANLPQMAIILPIGGGEAIKVPGDHIRFIGIAFMKPVGSSVLADFLSFPDGSHDIVIDRVYMHGNPKEEMMRGVALGAASRIAVIDSYIDEMHCLAVSGTCTDAQAIAGGGGSLPSSVLKIVNNYLQASGENIIFGGGAAAFPPTNIEIRRNHLDKPASWNPKDPTYLGTAYVSKDLFELKNAVRLLFEGNILTGSWGGFSQSGFAILLTPKNQAGPNGTNLCPTCLVTDITIRYNSIAHVAGGLQIANALSDNKGVPLDGERYSIHDLVIDDLDPVKYNGSGLFAQVSTTAATPILQNVTINHVTAFPVNMMLNVGAFSPMKNFSFTNNVITSGTYPIWSTGGGTTNCAYYDVPLITFTNCFQPYLFGGNLIATNLISYPSTKWPAGSSEIATFGINFVNYNNGKGGDYHLAPTSPYKGKATDGSDPGANIDLINSYTNGVN